MLKAIEPEVAAEVFVGRRWARACCVVGRRYPAPIEYMSKGNF
jgi:hypothetical protein